MSAFVAFLHHLAFVAIMIVLAIEMVFFVLVGLLSIYPTVTFLKWRKPLAQGRVPALDDALNRRLRLVMHAELTLLALMMLSAALMAKGVAYFGNAS